ncbi:sensor histidine kinase [Nocardioides sambongensis]|uniref:sensor histidine kinase n=1 Tax=Nocardioides sambongensis TaxID=2589074 RepID=UPI0011274AA1|nr:histidine kinase [Nocardioides sambongensis]
MSESRALRSRWHAAAAAAAAAWSATFLLGQWPAVALIPCGFAAGCWLLGRHPAGGALVVCGTQAAGLLAGVDRDNASGLLPALLALVVVGQRVPLRVAAPLVALFNGIILATGLSPVRTAVGVALFTSTFLVARHLGARRRRVDLVRRRALALEQQDVGGLSARVLASERRRLMARSATVVGYAVEEMTDRIHCGLATLDAGSLEQARLRGEGAVRELRDLLTLLRAPVAPDAEPGPERRTSRVPWTWDLALTSGACLLGLVELTLSDDVHLRPASAALGALVCATLVLRRFSASLAVAALTIVLMTAALTHTPMVQGVAEMGALTVTAWIAVRAGVRETLLLLALAAAAVAAAGQRSLEHAVVAAALVFLVVLARLVWRQLVRDHEREVGRVRAWEAQLHTMMAPLVVEERARLVRELHDVASHSLGVMLLQLGAAESTRQHAPATARAALEAALAVGIDARRELDALMGRLERRHPGPFATEVAQLVARVQAGGLVIRVHRLDDLAPSDAADTAYRVIQEGLTNVVKHAPDTIADLSVERRDGSVSIEIRSGVATRSPSGPGSRLGIAGLRERVARLGGHLEARPVATGFLLAARWPVARTNASEGSGRPAPTTGGDRPIPEPVR